MNSPDAFSIADRLHRLQQGLDHHSLENAFGILAKVAERLGLDTVHHALLQAAEAYGDGVIIYLTPKSPEFEASRGQIEAMMQAAGLDFLTEQKAKEKEHFLFALPEQLRIFRKRLETPEGMTLHLDFHLHDLRTEAENFQPDIIEDDIDPLFAKDSDSSLPTEPDDDLEAIEHLLASAHDASLIDLARIARDRASLIQHLTLLETVLTESGYGSSPFLPA